MRFIKLRKGSLVSERDIPNKIKSGASCLAPGRVPGLVSVLRVAREA